MRGTPRALLIILVDVSSADILEVPPHLVVNSFHIFVAEKPNGSGFIPVILPVLFIYHASRTW